MSAGRVSTPPRHRTCPERCADMGHPGVTFNPLLDQTFCLCGNFVYPGREATVDKHLACCGGPLTDPVIPGD